MSDYVNTSSEKISGLLLVINRLEQEVEYWLIIDNRACLQVSPLTAQQILSNKANVK